MRILKIIFTAVLITILFSCNNKNNEDGFITITGVSDVSAGGNKTITLWKIEHGNEIPVATSRLTENFKYGITFKPQKKGFYTIGSKENKKVVYISTKNLKLNIENNTISVLNELDEENKVIANWEELIKPLEKHRLTLANSKIPDFTVFFPFYEKMIPKMKAFKKEVNTSNASFNKQMKEYIDYLVWAEPINWLSKPVSENSKSAEGKDYPSYFNDIINEDNVTSASILNFPNTLVMLRMRGLYALRKVDKLTAKSSNDVMIYTLDLIKNDTLRGYVALNFANKKPHYNNEYLAFVEKYKKELSINDYLINGLKNHEKDIKSRGGESGFPFIAKDINGKDVSFTDFKGKVVYLDIWAEWCGPCIKEIPSLQKLEKELHGKDIVFVSLSLDKKKDKAKWEKFVKKKQLTGVQLFGGNDFNSPVAKHYGITSIPRFLLFDKEGVVVDNNAMRPSNQELKTQLLELISK